MERSSMYVYGLILMTTILAMIMILFAQPAGVYIRTGLEGIGNSLVSVGDNITSNEVEQEIDDMFGSEEDKIHVDIN